ncbi:MAG: ABC transporter ATP-binding protein [Calditrichaeota bacterium]|nr:ABC transporter ATP-binding protein [Calditrichota bacterium]
MFQTGKTKVALLLEALEKSYGKIKALHHLSLSVEPGQIVGLIGPDGSGKTTAMRIATGLLTPDNGSVRILDIDPFIRPRQAKELIGYMPQRFSLYPDLTVSENLRFFSDLYLVTKHDRIERQERLMKFSRLGPFTNRRASKLSGGMKQKLALMCALIHTPSLLILDEPTTGVDPVSRQEFWNILRELAEQGIGILVSTPYMDEASLCDNILMMYEGRIIGTGKPEDITTLFPDKLLEIRDIDITEIKRKLQMKYPTLSVQRFGDKLHIPYSDEEQFKTIKSAVPDRTQVNPIKPGIEDTFVALMSKPNITADYISEESG